MKLKDSFYRFFKSSKHRIDPIPRAAAGMDEQELPSWKRGEPFLQPYYSFENDTWNSHSTVPPKPADAEPLPSHVRLISWNIDAMIPCGPARMTGALEHLEELHSNTINSTTSPLIIFLQEMTDPDLDLIQEAAWIRKHFYITDRTHKYWEGTFYGTTTLIDKRVVVERVFRVHYEKTRMQRDGLFVDIAIKPEASIQKGGEQQQQLAKDQADHAGDTQPGQSNNSKDSKDSKKILRLCNTHLESLVSNPPIRPTQLREASKFLHPAAEGEEEETPSLLPKPHASTLAGDLNAFCPEDLLIVPSNNLLDTYLTLGGQEETEAAYTWGMQPPSRFPCGRLDKVLYCGGARPEKLEKIGVGLKVDVAKTWLAQQGANGRGPSDSDDEPFEQWQWVTDHLGLMADFTLVEGSSDGGGTGDV